MRLVIFAAIVTIANLTAARADGDPAAGKELFRYCKACHQIESDNEIIIKGGRTAPNLYGVIGRPAADLFYYEYSKGLAEAGELGLVWTPENFVSFVSNPNKFLGEFSGKDLRSKMPFERAEGAADIAAYLKSLGE